MGWEMPVNPIIWILIPIHHHRSIAITQYLPGAQLRCVAQLVTSVFENFDKESNKSSHLLDIPDDFVAETREERTTHPKGSNQQVDRLMCNFSKAIHYREKQQRKRGKSIIQSIKQMNRNMKDRSLVALRYLWQRQILMSQFMRTNLFQFFVACLVVSVSQDNWRWFEIELQQVLINTSFARLHLVLVKMHVLKVMMLFSMPNLL